MASKQPFDTDKFINPAQVGSIEPVTFDDGESRNCRALWVNTGSGLRYRVLADRGLDIDQAFFNQHSLSFLTHKGPTAPSRALDRGLDWLKSFPGGLMISCGPFNIGGPGTDDDGEYGLHGPHSNTAATIESVIQPEPHAGKLDMMIVGRIRYGGFYGPNVELRRTIRSTLGQSLIDVQDEFVNLANTDVPHAWLLHINFGYPLVDAGGEFCCREARVEPLPGHKEAAKVFTPAGAWKRIPGPTAKHDGPTSLVGYLYPRPDRTGVATVGVVNAKLGLGIAVRYNTNDFIRCVNWQHWGTREYVTALEPSTGGVENRSKDRTTGELQRLAPMARKTYRYQIEVVSDAASLARLKALNGRK